MRRLRRSVTHLAVLCTGWFVGMPASSQMVELPPAIDRPVQFSEVEALFKQRCQLCHGAQMPMNELRLDQREAALKGGYPAPSSFRVTAPGAS
ncbi:MAG: hypothetical protein O2795_18100 [Acidobacteria bacterium]|nr:hypothetical protein [Acidobacteriota bacterium]